MVPGCTPTNAHFPALSCGFIACHQYHELAAVLEHAVDVLPACHIPDPRRLCPRAARRGVGDGRGGRGGCGRGGGGGRRGGWVCWYGGLPPFPPVANGCLCTATASAPVTAGGAAPNRRWAAPQRAPATPRWEAYCGAGVRATAEANLGARLVCPTLNATRAVGLSRSVLLASTKKQEWDEGWAV